MSALWMWTQLDLRRRWRSLVVLALLVALSGGVVMAALAGANRGESAVPRLVKATDPTDAAIVANTSGFDWAPIRNLPYVDYLSEFLLANSGIILDVPKYLQSNLDFAHQPGDPVYRDFEKPVVLDGRMYDFNSPDEVVAVGGFLQRAHKKIGDKLQVRLPSPEQIDQGGPDDEATAAEYKGPTLTFTIVGRVITPWSADEAAWGGVMYSPAVLGKYPENFYGSTGKPVNDPDAPNGNGTVFNAMLKLKHGETDIPQLRRDLARISGRTDIDIWDMADNYRNLNHNPQFDARSLTAFAIAALVAALFLVGQAIGRYASGSAAELDTARALGMTPRQTVAASTIAPGIAGVLGAAIAVVGAGIASRRFPFGVAKWYEPDPGIRLDWAVLLPGLAVIVLLAVLAAALSAFVVTRARARDGRGRPSSVATLAAAANLPLPVQIGTRFALERGRGRSAVPVRPALVGAIVGVIGVVAVSLFSQAINDASTHPERFGKTYGIGGFFGESGHDYAPTDKIYAALVKNDLVTGIDDAKTDVALLANDRASVQLWQHTDAKPLRTVVLDGRMPEAKDEVTLTPGTLKTTGSQVGGTIRFKGTSGIRTFKVVGSAFVPRGPHNDYDQGGWLTTNGFTGLFGDDFKFHIMFVSTDPGTSTSQAAKTLNADLVKQLPDLAQFGSVVFDIDQAGLGVGDTMQQLKGIRKLPVALAVFLCLLAIGTIGHALASAVRRRRHDIAVLRAVGMTRWQTRWIVVVQATVLALVGVVFGLPIGVAAGRTVWRAVANFTPLQYVAPTAVLALLLIPPAVVVIANVLAALPARRASNTPVAAVLRAE
jgi:ABC-type lipoprotein release transport system permease subunit